MWGDSLVIQYRFLHFYSQKIADLDLKMYTVLTYVDSYLYRKYVNGIKQEMVKSNWEGRKSGGKHSISVDSGILVSKLNFY